MSYATTVTVQGAMAKFVISGSTQPTSTQVQAMIDGIAAEINSHLASVGYTVPVTTPDYFLAYLGELNTWGAVASVLKSMFPSATGPAETPAYAFWEKRYQAGLTDIDKRVITSPTSPMSSDSLARSYLTDYPANSGADGHDGFTGPAFGLGDQPVFAMGQEF